MSYITEQDLVDLLGEQELIKLTGERGATEIDHVKVGRAISFAVGTFESYARTRYTLPVPATELVKSKCLDLAVYKLRRDRATGADTIKKLQDELYNPTISFLKALSKGEAALDVPAAEETQTNPASPDRVLSGSTRTIFTDEKLDRY